MTQFQDPLSHAFYRYLQLLNYILTELGWIHKSTPDEMQTSKIVKF